jgi:medium-chain acyl-[acyl-carrier-protein] hydrolase
MRRDKLECQSTMRTLSPRSSFGASITVFPRARTRRTSPSPRLRLFCFPWAGGGVQSFTRWATALPQDIEVAPFELPGRGKRLHESGPKRMSELIPEIAASLSDGLGDSFAIFGHSLGALIAFELARHLKATVGREPLKLFVSGCKAPHLLTPKTTGERLSDADFQRRIARFNGTPREVLDNPDLMELILRALRTDFELFDGYQFEQREKLNCPIRALGGLYDPIVSVDAVKQWACHTSGAFSSSIVAGDHFFVASSEKQILSIISADLEISSMSSSVSSLDPSLITR